VVAGSGTVAKGVVQEWSALEGWGVIVSDETPGGCLVKRLQLVLSGYHELTAGQQVEFEYEETDEDGCQHRAMQVTVEGDDPLSIPFGNSTSGLTLKAFSITRCPQCGGRIVKEGGPGGLLTCSKCGYEEELPPFMPPRDARTTSPRRVLPFPAHEVVGTLEWVGSYSRERGPVLATGNVETRDDQTISLDVHRVDSVNPTHPMTPESRGLECPSCLDAPHSLMASTPRRLSSSRWLRMPWSTSVGCGSQSKISPTTRSGCRVR
jgi:cold shock CspA family protein